MRNSSASLRDTSEPDGDTTPAPEGLNGEHAPSSQVTLAQLDIGHR